MAKPRLVLVDLNPNSLEMAQKRLMRYKPQVYRRNVLEPLNIDGQGFDSIGLCHVLHCLPGTMQTKEIVFQHIQPLLNPGGVLFGATLLYRGVRRSPLATSLFFLTNLFGFMTNKQDDLEALEHNLKKRFSESHIEVIGCEALFWARK
jgi:SAM-dependent methyltransferase